MIQVVDLGLQFDGKYLYKNVNLKFQEGNCYGIIGANGAGKSTFLRLLSKELAPSFGEIIIEKKKRMSVLKQNQNAYDEYTVMDTVIMGHERLYDIAMQKEVLYAKEDLTDEEGNILAELEMEYAELDGWSSESNASILLNGLNISEDMHYVQMKELDAKIKVKVLLAQALFGEPDILVLDEPTNNLDIESTRWFEEFLSDFMGIVLVVSHDRHFLNMVCTHICDVDYGKIKLYIGNYDFWYQSSQLVAKQIKDQNKKAEAKVKELEEFIARFSANLSKSKQATSRKRMLDKIEINNIEPSTRRYPFIDFKPNREAGNDILEVKELSKPGLFKNLSFIASRGQKIAFVSSNSKIISSLFDIIGGVDEDYEGSFKWGVTITKDYLPTDNRSFFDGCKLNLIEWLAQYSNDTHESYIRGWLGRMLFSGEDAFKEASVLSGGEKVRCMLSKIMLSGANAVILDDPTNHLDLEAITALNEGLIRCKGNLFFSSHDHEILQTVADRIISIEEDRIIDVEMNYEDFITKFNKK